MQIRLNTILIKKLLVIILVITQNHLAAQSLNGISTDGSRRTHISTAVPFLLIMPQSRSSAMGHAGVARTQMQILLV
jgi:hypothetical protein